MENIKQYEKLPITEHQIKKFIGWCKNLSGKGKTVKVGQGETETTFISYESNGKKFINAKNVFMDRTWAYDSKKDTISVFHDDTNTLGRTLVKDGELDQKNLENDLKWFQYCIPSLKERISKKIKNVFIDK